jgi:hypothetical protein
VIGNSQLAAERSIAIPLVHDSWKKAPAVRGRVAEPPVLQTRSSTCLAMDVTAHKVAVTGSTCTPATGKEPSQGLLAPEVASAMQPWRQRRSPAVAGM